MQMHFLLAKCTVSIFNSQRDFKVIFVPTFCGYQHFTLRKIKQNQINKTKIMTFLQVYIIFHSTFKYYIQKFCYCHL